MQKITPKKFITLIAVLGLGGMIIAYAVAFAADTATVTATVTMQKISLSVSDGTVDYGILPADTTESTCSSELGDAQTVTSDGNVAEDFNIKGQNSANWTLASTAGTDQYVHSFATSTCSTWPGGTALSTSYATLATNVAPNATTTLNLQIHTPTSSSVYTQQNVDVMLEAVAH